MVEERKFLWERNPIWIDKKFCDGEKNKMYLFHELPIFDFSYICLQFLMNLSLIFYLQGGRI